MKRIVDLTFLLGFCVCILIACSGSSSDAPSISPGNTTPVVDDPADPSTGLTGLYRDAAMTCATWDELASGTTADCAIGDWDKTVSVAVTAGVAKLTVLTKASGYYSGGTLCQLPSQVSSGSYYDFSGVKYLKFWIKSADIAPATIKLILQNAGGTNLIDGVALSTYGITSITSWTEVSIDVSSYSSQKIGVAVALLLGTAVGSSIEVKQIGFLDASGNSVDITSKISWPETATSIKSKMSLAWSDEFAGTSTAPDTSIWCYDTVDTVGGGWGNSELETYTDTRANAYVSDGTLKIKAVKDGSGNWTSARMKSKGLKDFTYGYVEFKAKIAVGAGTWPALWMLPTGNDYGAWPASGEIDVMEAATSTWGLGYVTGTVHRTAGSGGNGASAGNKTISTAGSAFHLYAVYWTSSKIVWYYDDVKLGEYLSSGGTGSAWWPFDRDFHVIMNLAVGGNLGGSVASSLSSDVMEVDYVRVYQ